MRYPILALSIQLLLTLMFFVPIYYLNETMISGLSFIMGVPDGVEGMLGSRIISIVMMIGLLASLITVLLTWLDKGNKKLEDISTITFNLTLVVGLVLIVVQGAYMSYLGYIWIGLMVAAAYLRSLKEIN